MTEEHIKEATIQSKWFAATSQATRRQVPEICTLHSDYGELKMQQSNEMFP
jgi:hypothetical protein